MQLLSVIIGDGDVLISIETLQVSDTNCTTLSPCILDHSAAVVCQIMCYTSDGSTAVE